MIKNSIQGNKKVVHDYLTDENIGRFKNDFENSQQVTDCLALIDEKGLALDWLEHSIKIGFINYPFLNEHDPFLENIRGEERFKKLMERVKHEWENFEV
jgi:hypothetical protein